MPVDLHAHGDAFVRDPHPLFSSLLAGGQAHRVRFTEGFDGWLIVGHEASRNALNDPRLINDPRRVPETDGPGPGGARRFDDNLLSLDAPDHTRLRRLVAKEFTARRVRGLEPRVQEIVDGLVGTLAEGPRERVDLVEALSFPLPITVIAELLGVPFLERETFRHLSSGVLESTNQEEAAAMSEDLHAFLARLVDAKRAAGGEDLLGALLEAASREGEEDSLITGAELLGMANLLLVAGYETTVNLISSTVLCLLQHPEQLAQVRADPSLVAAAVEETLRFEGPVARSIPRFATEPIPFDDGTVIPAGEVVCIGLASAGRDPERFPHPDEFDIHRDTGGHLAFGHGAHFCLGAPLARLEARTAVTTLLARIPALALDVPASELSWRTGTLLRGPRQLPVRLG
ncbi:cytochrome P450 family protein [Streptomyces sulphureus]|uniref:cytochrome P450 family protein n=1 Tax=Streptomyces sulphureus TaxID=47758 RepID=UPI00036CD748|nr:cytochrome P450 [Streptomyces sulphureus]